MANPSPSLKKPWECNPTALNYGRLRVSRGLINWKPDVVAAALQRAVNKDRPALIQRALVFYTVVKNKRGEGIDKDGVATVMGQAVDILVSKGWDRDHVESIIFKVEF